MPNVAALDALLQVIARLGMATTFVLLRSHSQRIRLSPACLDHGRSV